MSEHAPSPVTSAGARPAPAHTAQLHQPFVHDLTAVLSAPVQAWSERTGEMRGIGAHGIYLGDVRIVSSLELRTVEAELSPLGVQGLSAREVLFTDAVSLADGLVDPLVTLHRARRAHSRGIHEVVRLVSADTRPRRLRLRLAVGIDDSSMSAVKDPRVLAGRDAHRPEVRVDGTSATWTFGAGTRATLTAGSRMAVGAHASEVVLDLDLRLEGAGEVETSWSLTAHDPALPFCAPEPPAALAGTSTEAAARSLSATSPEDRLALELLARSLSDLEALRLRPLEGREEAFFAAGAPWFFTLFGRDSIIAASLALPVDLATAMSTLRTLAARQGVREDPETAEQPGKILHEVRAQGIDMVESYLPPVYYGTIDATPLWIELLHEAWSAGATDADVAALRPALTAAATWLLEHADADGDGFLEYIDASGHGLANQGWKDSGDSIRFADGSIAEGSIALCEVQGYAYAAALHAAEILDHLGDPGELPSRLREWAGNLRVRFGAEFWCEDELGPYVALALDGAKQKVDGVASNMGHLLGTGILDPEEEAIVVRRLMDPTMFSGYGIRTLSTTNDAYWPLRYHGGSVWTHDTGYILRGMLRAGFADDARSLARGLLLAAEGFDLRLPELFSGDAVHGARPPMPYPASCRPQAWAAASAVPVAQALGVLLPFRS